MAKLYGSKYFCSICLLIFLIILLCFVKSKELYSLINFAILFILIKWITMDNFIALGGAIIISIFFYLSNPQTYWETFESVVDTGLENVNMEEETYNEEDGNYGEEEYDEEGVKEFNVDELGILDPDSDTEHQNTKSVHMTPSKAQRETFRLINTIKQLDETVKGLAPTLKEGAGIIEKFKKLKLVTQ